MIGGLVEKLKLCVRICSMGPGNGCVLCFKIVLQWVYKDSKFGTSM